MVFFSKAMMMSPVPVTILTGFLGSGKTTLLNRAVSTCPAMADCAVLVNEFGEIGLDHLLVESVDDDVVLLQSGCICCTVQDDLAAAIRSLMRRRSAGSVPPFSRILVETTGIADPVPILQLVSGLGDLPTPIEIGGVVTVVDAVYGKQNLDDLPECLHQVAAADTLVISKTDQASAVETEQVTTAVRQINRDADLFDAHDEAFDLARAFTARRKHRDVNTTVEHHHGHGFSTYTLTWDQPVNWDNLRAWLDGLLLARGDQIFRLKGLLNLENAPEPAVLQVVQHSVYPLAALDSWNGKTPRTTLTFITRNFSRVAAINSLKPFIQGAGL